MYSVYSVDIQKAKQKGVMEMIEITNFRNGAIVNAHHGSEDGRSIKVRIEGISSTGRPVKVNGLPAEMDGRRFSTEVELDKQFNDVTASVMTPYGSYSQQIVLAWDKASFRRFNFYIDDHSFTFTDLAKQRPARAFDHFYLAGLKAIHDRLGFKVTLNVFYRNDHHGFELKDMPDTWRSEFQDNADWLRFSFHSYSEFPDRPYLESDAEEFGRDYDLVKGEIIRFAGEECFIPPIVIHWANIHPAVAAELIRRGTRAYSHSLRPRVMGGPSLAERQKGGNMERVESRSLSGEDKATVTDGLDMHYSLNEENDYLRKHTAYYDSSLGLFFFHTPNTCCNLTPLASIPGNYAAIFKNAERHGVDIFGGASHEQYTFPYYPNYLPDHLERIECAVRCMVEAGCRPVFFNEGMLGNRAWD